MHSLRTVLALVLTSVITLATVPPGRAETKPPNIVIIICTRTPSETFTRHATKAFFTAILAGYSRAGMMRPT